MARKGSAQQPTGAAASRQGERRKITHERCLKQDFVNDQLRKPSHMSIILSNNSCDGILSNKIVGIKSQRFHEKNITTH